MLIAQCNKNTFYVPLYYNLSRLTLHVLHVRYLGESITCDNFNESYRVELSCDTIYYVMVLHLLSLKNIESAVNIY